MSEQDVALQVTRLEGASEPPQPWECLMAIAGHSSFPRFSRAARFKYWQIRGWSLAAATRDQKEWLADVWRCLYLDTPMPRGETLF